MNISGNSIVIIKLNFFSSLKINLKSLTKIDFKFFYYLQNKKLTRHRIYNVGLDKNNKYPEDYKQSFYEIIRNNE